MRIEDRLLAGGFGGAFDEYRRRVHAYVPFLDAWREPVRYRVREATGSSTSRGRAASNASIASARCSSVM